MKPPSQSLLQESVREILLYLIALIFWPFRIITLFVPVTRAAKAQLRALNTKPSPEGEGRKSYENREGFPRYSRDIHAILTPSPPPHQGYGRVLVHSGYKFNSQWYNQALFDILIAFALAITLCGCGKWNTKNPMVPISPTLTVGSTLTLNGDVNAIAAKGNYLYVCLKYNYTDSTLFYIVDASDIANPKVIGSAIDYRTYFEPYGLALYGSYAYVDTYKKGLVVLDISNPSAPKVLASYDTLATIPKGIIGNHLYGVGYGLDYLSLSDPVHPKREGRFNAIFVSNTVVPWDETRCAMVIYPEYQISIVDFSIPASPRIAARSSETGLYSLAFCAGSLYFVPGYRTEEAFRFSWNGGDSIQQGGKVEIPGYDLCLTSLGNRLVVGVGHSYYAQNLFLLSTTGPQSPYVVGEGQLPLNPYHLTADGNRIYADMGNGELVAVEVTEH